MARIRWAVNCAAWIPTREEWLSAVSRVQKEEKERISKFVFSRDAKLALVGRLLIRSALVSCLEVENDKIVLGRTQRGRPVLVEPQGGDRSIDFNLSHQGMYAVLATEVETQGILGTHHNYLDVSIVRVILEVRYAPDEVKGFGVDVMQLSQPRGQSLPEFFHTMRRQFTSAEWEFITAPPTDKQQLAMFYRFWCLKESFIKAEGSGLSYGLQKLEFVPGDGWPPPEGTLCTGSRLFIEGAAALEWVFEESLFNEHCTAVAVRAPYTASYDPGSSFSELTVPHLISTLHPLHPACSRDWENFTKMENNPRFAEPM